MLLRSISTSLDREIQSDLQKEKCVLGQELVNDKISIRIRCMWDSTIRYGDIAEPMYKTWEYDGSGKNGPSQSLKAPHRSCSLDGVHTLVTNALITDEHSTVTGK